MDFAEQMGRMMGGQPPSTAQACNATRVIQAGGDLVSLLLHPSVTPFERIWRRLPEEGIHLATRERPFTFEVGAYRVPKNMALLVAEYKFDVFRFNGASPWDMVPMETRRLPLSMGYDINFDQYRKGNLQVEVLPVPPPTQQEAFTPTPTGGTVMSGKSVSPLDLFGQASTAPPAIATVYDNTSGSGPNAATMSQSAIPALGAGSALLPQDQEEQQGPRRLPFTFYARENQAVQLRVAVFGMIPIPIAFFESRLKGYLMPLNTLDMLLRSVSPCSEQIGV